VIDWLKNRLERVVGEDSNLIRQAKKGNKEAFGNLYLKYLPGIYRYFFFRIGQDKQTAEDLSEEVFFKAWEALPRYEEKGWRFSAWLYRIAHNLLVDSYRKEKETADWSDFYLVEDKSLEIVLAEEERTVLYKAIETLTDDQKQVVLLKFVEGFETREISEITGKREDAIRALQARALQKLKEILEKDE